MNDILFAGKHFVTYTVNRHKHSSWELVYCTGESGRFVFDGLELPYQEGEIVLIPPELPHENLSEEGFTNIHLTIGDSTLSFDSPVVVRDDNDRPLLHLFADAYSLYCGDPEKRAALLSAYGNLIVHRIIAHQATSPKNRIAAQIERSLVQNYANASYQADEALASLPYCTDYLCRLFRREMGSTPHQYLTSLRLQAAADMLCQVYSSANVTEVAHMCGFHNPLYFSRLFKRRYGVSPTEYYRQRLEAEQHTPADSDSQKITLPQ